ncbi:MAG: alpha-amylase family glycosyl hydrolase [Candidatus Binatia bacterium]
MPAHTPAKPALPVTSPAHRVAIPASSGDAPWWKTAVFYQVYPRSFLDTGGNGVGDLEGIRRRLDHLSMLGVDALWISPFFRSPMKDGGYDVSDYCDVDPLFGTLADFDRLLADAHARGLRVIIDWVPNHTSDRHPWFIDSRSSRHSARRNWYVWRDARPDGSAPNNWMGQFFQGPAWTLDAASGQYYLHCFLPEQPDLNWNEPAVVAAMHDTLRFWLDRGVDGFRMDVVHLIGKDPELADDPEHLKGLTHVPLNHCRQTHPLLRDIRRLLDSYPGERTSVGEVFLLETAQIAEYYGRGDELHLCFNFLPLFTPFDAAAWREQVERIERELAPLEAWPTWVLSNHDNQRHCTRYGSEARARAAAFLLLGLRGTPFLYAGEELGMADAQVPDARRLDPGMRDGCRAPIPWDASPAHGWVRQNNWLPWPPMPEGGSAEEQAGDPASMLHLYRRLLRARRTSAGLKGGDQELLSFGSEVDAQVLGIRRYTGGDERVVLVNFGADDVAVPFEGIVEVHSSGFGEGQPFGGRLGGESAVMLRPASVARPEHASMADVATNRGTPTSGRAR